MFDGEDRRVYRSKTLLQKVVVIKGISVRGTVTQISAIFITLGF